jgi:protocatechuate 3,4-dioxygenase beta subunit
MKWPGQSIWTRSRFLRAAVIAPAAGLIAACTGGPDDGATAGAGTPQPADASGAAPAVPSPAGAQITAQGATPSGAPVTQVLAPTPACGDEDDDPTPAQTEGPYFTPNSPERTSLLEPGMPGRRLTVTGYVLDTECRPIAGALIDFWQADDAGQYDNVGYRLRGHQFTDENGRYELETIVPGLYPGRTRHIHVKVQAPDQPVLTTQQYFPNEPRNARDGIYRPELEMATQDNPDGSMTATFDYVLAVR